jgi:hypothetical protein
VFACKAKDPRPEIEKNLEVAMQNYLYKSINNDSSNVKYHVESVVYFDDEKRNLYTCNFTVNMKTKMFDTTGVMQATVSKDFITVSRLY